MIVYLSDRPGYRTVGFGLFGRCLCITVHWGAAA